MSVKPTKAYVQFSKRMVVMVMVSVTVIVAISVIGMIYDSAYDQLPEVMEHYLQFASVVFVAYSGNSAVEKWLVSRTKANAQSASLEDEEADFNSVG